MRRAILKLLRCPRCNRGQLLPDTDTVELIFGPIRCSLCQSSFPVGEGVADLISERGQRRPVQAGMEHPLVARSYERYVRPLAQLVCTGRRLDVTSEFVLYRSLLGKLDAPMLDLGCGTGLLARRLAKEAQLPPVVGLDVSKAMIEEGVAQAREGGVMVDFVRAEAPPLPFQDNSLAAILQAGSLHLFEDASSLLMEVGRVLRPGGTYVASTYLPPKLVGRVHERMGLYPRTERDLRNAVASAGLVHFERLVFGPLIIVKSEKPPLA
jgi:SAM-dependent methyltransferase